MVFLDYYLTKLQISVESANKLLNIVNSLSTGREAPLAPSVEMCTLLEIHICVTVLCLSVDSELYSVISISAVQLQQQSEQEGTHATK